MDGGAVVSVASFRLPVAICLRFCFGIPELGLSIVISVQIFFPSFPFSFLCIPPLHFQGRLPLVVFT